MKPIHLLIAAAVAAALLGGYALRDPLKNFIVARLPHPKKKGATIDVVSLPDAMRGFIKS